MNKEINICGLKAKCGEKVQGFVKILDSETKMPVTIINGEKTGKTILLTAGIHGAEYPCIKTAIELAKEIKPSEVSGTIIIVHPVNTQGFIGRSAAIVPEDNKNINRVFPGNINGTISDKIAYVITNEFQSIADFYVDMHGGDLHESLYSYVYYPGIGEEEVIEESKKIAEKVNVPYMVRSSARTGAYNSAAILGTPSILIERGGCGLCTREDVDAYKKDLYVILKTLEVLQNSNDTIKKTPFEINEVKYIDSEHDGCLDMFVSSGDKIKKGQKLYEITDFFGNVIAEHNAEFDGVVLYNTVSYAISENASIIAYGKLN